MIRRRLDGGLQRLDRGLGTLDRASQCQSYTVGFCGGRPMEVSRVERTKSKVIKHC